jgi:hypothetical protein
MDLTRGYYRVEKMTAPAFRLEYIYTYTTQSNAMRSFLIQTAAYRAMCEQQSESDYLISDTIREVLMKNNEMAVDFSEAVVGLAKNNLADPRHGSSCLWHSHEHTPSCIPVPAEAWQSDGAADDMPLSGDAATVSFLFAYAEIIGRVTLIICRTLQKLPSHCKWSKRSQSNRPSRWKSSSPFSSLPSQRNPSRPLSILQSQPP